MLASLCSDLKTFAKGDKRITGYGFTVVQREMVSIELIQSRIRSYGKNKIQTVVMGMSYFSD